MKFIRTLPQERTVFRIIPHAATLNQQNRKLMVALHELFLVKTKRYKLHLRDGFYITVKPNPDLWFCVKMAAVDEEKRIEFYISVPTDYSEAFRTKFRNHEQWRRCTIDEAEEFEFPQQEDTDLYKLQNKRHDIFSLRADHTEQTTPIRDILTVSDELAAGESIDLFIRLQSLDRRKWKKIADYNWSVWEKGFVPARPGVDPVRFAKNAFSLVAYIALQFVYILRDSWTALQNQFFKAGPEVTKQEIKLTDPERAEILINGQLSKRTNEKRVKPTFRTSIRLAVHSGDEVRRGMLARSVGASFDSLTGDNCLEMVRVNIRPQQAIHDLKEWRLFDVTPTIMSVDEAAKLCQLPTAAVQEEFAEAIEANKRVEVEIPPQFIDESGILAGTATDRELTHEIHIPTANKDFTFTPRAFVGSPRMGKDQAAINMIVEAKRKHGIGAIIPDVIDERNGHRGMGDAIRDHLDPEDIIDIDLGETTFPVYFGLESIVKNVKDYRMQADRIAEEITAFLLDGEEDSILRTADYVRENAKATMGDILGMKLMFMSKKYRSEKIKELDDVLDMDIWKDYHKMSASAQAAIYGPAMRRINQIYGSEFLRPMFCQQPAENAINLYQAIQDGKVIIFRIRIPGATLSERIKQTLVYWIVMNVFLIVASMDGKGPGTYLVLNEPHQFLSKGLIHFMKRLLREGPKYRLTPVVLFHDFEAFREYPGFTKTLESASINWHLFANTSDDVFERLFNVYLSKTFENPIQAQNAVRGPNPQANTPPSYIACWLDGKGGVASPFVVDALPMVGDRYESKDNSFLTKRHVRQYGRPIKDVLAEIKERNKLTYQNEEEPA